MCHTSYIHIHAYIPKYLHTSMHTYMMIHEYFYVLDFHEYFMSTLSVPRYSLRFILGESCFFCHMLGFHFVDVNYEIL